MAVTIRAVVEGEAEALKGVRLRALEDSPDAFIQPLVEAEGEPIAVYEERVASTVRGETLNLVAVDESGAFVGLAAGIPWEGRTRVVSVWVDPTVRGTGVGAELVERIAAWSLGRGTHCQIEVAPGNDPALRLYRRLGFEPTGIDPPEGCDVVLIREAATGGSGQNA